MSLYRLLHWGPILALLFTKCVTFTVIHTTEMWLPSNTFKGRLNFIIYCIQVVCMLYTFFSCIFQGPGFVPLKWRPYDSTKNAVKDKKLKSLLQFCEVCDGFKPPRAHHCRKCNRCIMKMDHHCPWVNTCIGNHNHCYFMLFLFFAIVGAFHSLILLVTTMYRGFNIVFYFYKDDGKNIVYLTRNVFIFVSLSIGLTVGVVISLGGMLFIQSKAITSNITSIEDWILTKANKRREDGEAFIHPYDLGVVQNVMQFFWKTNDGLCWPVREGCDQYTLTREQLEQKRIKRENTGYYQVIKNYDGRWFPIFSYGFCTCIRFPLSDENRIVLNENETVKVTRWKSNWLYGEVLSKKKDRWVNNKFIVEQRKGWFPRSSVVEIEEPKNKKDI